MDIQILKTLRNIYYKITPDSVLYQGNRLPAKYLRYCGFRFQNNQYYFNSALNEANRLINTMNVNANSVVLDVGCGVGRLAIGLKQILPDINEYNGIDISMRAITWCKKYLKSNSNNFRFILLNMKNELYNREGKELDDGISLPFQDNAIDAIYLYSVFSHMNSLDIKNYLYEFKRIIRRDGNIFFTAFIEDCVETESENPLNYRMKWTMPLHCVRFDRKYFENMIKQCGFKIIAFEYEVETDGQSGVYLSLI